jgi:hypothetical protein
MDKKDPLGYYTLLGLTTTASASQIKSAFRQKAKKLHPDQNSSRNSVHQFQQLNEAYQVLSNPDARARYDTLYAQVPQLKSSYQHIDLTPITCSYCKKITAQPRYVIFYRVISFIVVTVRTPIAGIFCSKCAERKAFQATIVTWLMGWWGLPWGLAYSITTICNNLVGGSKPHDLNVRLLIYQACFLVTQNNPDLARSVVESANNLTKKVKPDERAKLQELIKEISCYLGVRPVKPLKDVWSVPNRSFYLQGSILLLVIMLVSSLTYSPAPISTQLEQNTEPKPLYSPPLSQNSPPIWPQQAEGNTLRSTPPQLRITPLNPQPLVTTLPQEPNEQNVPLQSPSPLVRVKYIRPTTADNGAPFPKVSSYIEGYGVQLTDGYSSVIVDNLQNNSDVFVKLFTLDVIDPYPVRVFFIRAGETFKIENVKAGNYDVRYRDLDSGKLSRTEPFSLEEIEYSQGIEFSEITLTLYKVFDGNMQTYTISENEFK